MKKPIKEDIEARETFFYIAKRIKKTLGLGVHDLALLMGCNYINFYKLELLAPTTQKVYIKKITKIEEEITKLKAKYEDGGSKYPMTSQDWKIEILKRYLKSI